MNKPLFLKFFLSFMFVIVLSSALTMISSYHAIRDTYITQITKAMAGHSRSMMPETLTLLQEGRKKELQPLAKKFAGISHTRITIMDSSGDVLADSSIKPSAMYNHRKRPEVAEALAGNTGRSVRVSPDLGHEMVYIALPVTAADNTIAGVVRFSVHAKETNDLLATVRDQILLVTFFGILISLGLSVILAHILSKPIKEIQQAVEKITDGDFSVRVPHSDISDEIGRLGHGFNLMTEHIRDSFSDLSHRQEELQSILSIMSEGLLLLDAQGRITRSNESIRRIVGREDIDGKFYWEILRSTFLSEFLEGTYETHISHELVLGSRTYLCNASSMPSVKATVLILFDITEIKNMERIKRDLVVNVSHELNTPLTAIKGFTETMLEDATGEDQQYLGIIKRHADRLQNIVRDLLTLSELEEHGTILEKEQVNLGELINSISSIFEQRLEDKNLELLREIPTDLVFNADPFRLEQLFTNLIDNAIKYTEKGNISISAVKKQAHIIITIKDTGIGMASEHLARIFERFYTADKSRSRALGGTGLGLSIAKHITTLHKGSLKVESTPNVGTTFIITLPNED